MRREVGTAGCIWDFGGRGGPEGSTMVPFERAIVVSYRLSLVTITLSLTIRPHFAIKCLRRSNQINWASVTFEQNLESKG